MAAQDSILAGVSQYEVNALADIEMSQIQGEAVGGGGTGALVTLLNLNLNLSTDSAVLGLAGGLLGSVLGVFGVWTGGL